MRYFLERKGNERGDGNTKGGGMFTVTMEAPRGMTLTVAWATAWPARERSPKAARALILTIVDGRSR